MAEMKKYLDVTGLGALVDQIKAEDVKVLDAAKKYADDKGKLYDASGSAATAEQNAKAYTDELANGAVKTNAEAIAKLNGDATTEGSVAKAVKDAQDTLQGNIDGVDAKADKNAEDIAAINNTETGILKQAKDYTDAEVEKVQGVVDGLDARVGQLPEGTTATSVIEYVNKKTEGIATDAALGELNSQVSGLQTAVQGIQADYLKGSDKTELEGKVTAEATARESADNDLSARIKVVEDDYLKAADKTELTNAITTAKQEVVATILGEGVDEDFDTLKEVADWILSDTTGAAALQTKVATLESEMDDVQADVEQAKKDIDAVEVAVSTKAEAQELTDAVAALEGVDAGLTERIVALETAVGESGSVAQDIADAKQAAIDAAAQDATTKANTAESNAKSHADGLNTAMSARVDALEAIDHDHSNKAELDLIATGDKSKWDEAAGKAHVHANATELAKIADGDVAKWNASEQNAKTYADGLNTTMTGKVDGVDARVKTLEETIVDKAEADDLDAAVVRIAKNETDIASLTSSVNSFTAITPDEVTALFA